MRTYELAALGVIVAAVYLYLRGYRVRYKDGLVLGTAPEMTRALPTIDRVSRETIGRESIVTSATDGTHSAGSLHYRGLAVDIRTRDLTTAEISRYANTLDDTLNGAAGVGRYYSGTEDRRLHYYDVIIEATHIHIEYDPAADRKGVIRL